MNFNQWKNYADKQAVSKVTYVCGDQPALVELVVEDIVNILQVPVTDFVELDAKTDNMLWEKASQYPLDPAANRLTIVRNAEAVQSWSELTDWLSQSRANPSNYLLLVSNQSDAQAIFAKGKRVGYTEHIELIRTKGKFIKCSQPNDEDLINWARRYGLTASGAQHIVERTSGDTSLMLDVFRKLNVWNGAPSNKALDLLCEEQALDSFADYLILRDKKSAIMALKTMSEEDKAKIITRLDYRLDTVMEIARHVRRRMYAGDISAATGIKIYIVKRFTAISKEYDDKKIRYCRQLLALIDSALKDGAKVGVWETLVTLW
jgi:DNA polymerase III delta subunit